MSLTFEARTQAPSCAVDVEERLYIQSNMSRPLKIMLKSAYEPATPDDGTRIFVDRLWPRGVTKERLAASYWAKDISPSNELRKWYGHEPAKWDEFQARYTKELDDNRAGIDALVSHMGTGPVTFVFSSKERHLNNAVVLRDYVDRRR